jgi:hypothetical protein
MADVLQHPAFLLTVFLLVLVVVVLILHLRNGQKMICELKKRLVQEMSNMQTGVGDDDHDLQDFTIDEPTTTTSQEKDKSDSVTNADCVKI